MGPVANLIILLFVIGTYTEGARILGVFPFPMPSHSNFIRSITDELANRGHELIIYTSLPTGNPVKNTTEIVLNNSLKTFIKKFSIKELRDLGKTTIFGPPSSLSVGLKITDLSLNDNTMKTLINSSEKYDLVLIQAHFSQEALIAFGHKFQVPVVSLNTFSTYYPIDEYIGNPFGTAYLPTFEAPYTDRMTFMQRVHNVLRTFIYASLYHLSYIPQQEKLMRKYFNYKGSENLPLIGEMLQNVSLVIVNSQLSVDYPRPWVPNVIAAGGSHISKIRKPLPQDLKEFMDNSKNGVIYFSFGSLVPSDQMSDDMKSAFLNAFGKLKQNVLWKLPVESFHGLPKNVKISKWLPQHEILAHKNCVAFITHGGLLSQEEAIYFGVPFIGVPFFADQFVNINRAVDRGFGIHLNFYNISEESVSWAINEILSSPTYRENAKKYSAIFRDNPVAPAENAAYWIEYVLRHKGAPHLRSEGRNLPYYQYLLLDVIAVILLTLSLLLYIIYKICLIICNAIFSQKNNTKHLKTILHKNSFKNADSIKKIT